MKAQFQIARTKIPAAPYRLSALFMLIALALGLSACAGIHPSPETAAQSALSADTSQGSPHLSLESAARAALVEGWAGTNFRNRDQLRVGAIVQSDDQFTWLEPESSKAGPSSVVRLGLQANHVATYIIHPRNGSIAVDRANEQITKHEKRLVDQIDPLHRPIFVLTPSGRVLAYAHGAPVSELASVRNPTRFFTSSSETRTAELSKRP